ncbi:2-oxo acid dehydrogenase subunit E2 [Microbacterium paludicola]|uniref:Dihydrolipoamide acetyltransferase component of pyruvate dehydrogenase complex n=1 Tax=Microbacterium paludicola TaxID=300019 RepID=A0A4Y9FUH4_9MICO|nr:dihydrolipoamide acetyltransferase family protein [Microbacterium paludicola]MBF0817112.1 2-oxo acid dehydrogenase subunit E2 [Microbacterium paludicola]TFU32176.1 2-oxo acid dehydrogenase subunit E2 [Microbacterium paludicola]
MQTFHLPDVGEGLTEAEIVSWHVAPGDAVAVDDVIAEIETAKSLVELPSPFAGTVGELLVAEGDTVNVGSPIITVVPADAATAAGGDAHEPTGPGQHAETEGGGSVLVGYGTGGEAKTRRRNKPEKPVASSVGVIAKPPIRKLARDLGVDLSEVRPSGPSNEVTRDDVMGHAQQASVFRNISTPEWPAEREQEIPVPPKASPQVAPDARIEEVPVKGVRKATAAAMVGSAHTAPHVSVWTDVDASRTMEYVKRLKSSPDFADIKVSPLLIVARAVLWAARRTPMINSAWVDGDDGAKIHVRNYVNLGIAAATPRGLLVPNIKDAQDLSMRELAKALERLTLTAREGKTTPADQQGGTITITNIGVFGMDAGTPIINPGESAIVAMGAIRQKPWVVDGEVRPRWVTTVSGSFDHRVVDGDAMSRFLADVAAILEEPALLLD